MKTPSGDPIAAKTRIDAVNNPWYREMLILSSGENNVQEIRGSDIPETIPVLYPMMAPPRIFIKPAINSNSNH